MQLSNPSQKVELTISCRQLKNVDVIGKSDPFAQVYLIQKSQKTSLGKTETFQNNLNPNFTKTFQFNYQFEVRQELLIEIFDKDSTTANDSIGSIQIDVALVAGAKGRTKVADLLNKKKQKTGTIILKLDQLAQSNKYLWWQWSGKKLLDCDILSKSDPFIEFYRLREGSSNDYTLVHKTEYIKNNINPIWKPFEINMGSLTQNEQTTPFKIICYDFDGEGKKPDFIGETLVYPSEFLHNGKKEFQLTNPKTKKNPGTLVLNQVQLTEKASFLDYIQGGTQLNFCLAVDFTGSNGVITQPNSLHYINPQGGFNQYQQVIASVGQIILGYDYDQNVPCFGYGAITKYPQISSSQVNHCFPLNGNLNNAEVHQIQGIMEAYNYALQHVSLSGPTYFGPVIENSLNFSNIIKNQNADAYLVLLIITDGAIHDMDKTLELVRKAENLPMSIIIVGVGNDNFSSMETLDGDKTATKKLRDLVQFVPFNKFSGNPELLAENVLAELPDQLVKYMTINGKKPVKIQQVNMNLM